MARDLSRTFLNTVVAFFTCLFLLFYLWLLFLFTLLNLFFFTRMLLCRTLLRDIFVHK